MGGERSTFLFKMPSWIDGTGQVLNLSGQGYEWYRVSASPAEADRRALRQDWAAVGDDLRRAARGLGARLSLR